MISLAYYLRVVAAVWMRPAAVHEAEGERKPHGGPVPAVAGGSQEADALARGARCRVIVALAFVAAAGTVVFGVVPAPLVEWASQAGASLAGGP
jgi:NADH-quinone oxidoreductase subunit N